MYFSNKHKRSYFLRKKGECDSFTKRGSVSCNHPGFQRVASTIYYCSCAAAACLLLKMCLCAVDAYVPV